MPPPAPSKGMSNYYTDLKRLLITHGALWRLTSVKKTERMTRLIQWMMPANWKALLTGGTIEGKVKDHTTHA